MTSFSMQNIRTQPSLAASVRASNTCLPMREIQQIFDFRTNYNQQEKELSFEFTVITPSRFLAQAKNGGNFALCTQNSDNQAS